MYETKGVTMKISSIQPNYINRFSFRNNNQQTVTTQPASVENKSKGLSKDTQTAIGVGAGLVVLAGLVYAGYRGKLGAKIQKLLGGAKKETSKAAENFGTEVNSKNSSVKSQETKLANKTEEISQTKIDTNETKLADETAEISPAKIDTEETNPKKDIINRIDAEDAEIVEEIPYKLTAAELQNLPHEQSLAKFKDDINSIAGNHDNIESFSESLKNYIVGLDIDIDNIELNKENAEFFDFVYEKSIEKFGKELDNLGSLNELKLNISEVKLALGDVGSARNLVMDIINSGKMDDDRVAAFISLRKICKAAGNIDESSKILDEAMNGDVKKINELKDSINKIYESKTYNNPNFTDEEKVILEQFSDATFYYDAMFKNLRDVYGETYENGVMNRLRDIMRDAFNFYNEKNIETAIK